MGCFVTVLELKCLGSVSIIGSVLIFIYGYKRLYMTNMLPLTNPLGQGGSTKICEFVCAKLES